MQNELFEYEINDGSVTIVKYLGRESEVTIPAEIDGRPVTIIGSNAFDGCNFVQAVHIPNTVTLIKKNAFTGCVSMKDVIIPDSVTKIEENAFGSALNAVVLPKHLNNPDNFKNIFMFMLCECGQEFRVNLQSSKAAVCPRCGSLKYVPVESTSMFWVYFVFFAVISVGAIFAGARGIDSRLCIVVIFSNLVLLLSEANKLHKYQSFKAKTNPALAKRKRIYSSPKSVELPSAGSDAGTIEPSTAALENTAVQSDGPKDSLQIFQKYLDDQKDPSNLPPLPEYHHQNVPLGCVLIPFYLIVGPLALTCLIVPFSYGLDLPEALCLWIMDLPLLFVLFLMIRLETNPLKMTVNEKGIKCNKMNPENLPWDQIVVITFKSSPVMVIGTQVRTDLVVKLKLKGNKKRNLGLRFQTDMEAMRCQKILQEFFSRAKLKRSK